MKMKFIALVFFAFTPILLFSQSLVKTEPFSLRSYVEPDYFKRLIEVEDGFVTVAKVKGNEFGSSEYMLERYNLELEKQWQTELELNKYDNITGLYYTGGNIHLLVNEHNDNDKLSFLLLKSFNPEKGNLQTSDTLFSEEIQPWNDYLGKGTVKQTFNSAVASKQTNGYVTPLEYRYKITLSPDSNKVMVYRFDYSQKTLYSDIKVFDNNFNLLQRGKIPVDHSYLAYEYMVNNQGEIYISKANRFGRVALIKYNLETLEFKMLNIEISNYQRDNLKLFMKEDNVVYLAKLNKSRQVLKAISFAIFDFNTMLVDQYNFYEFEESFKKEIVKAEEESGLKIEEEFKNFSITDFWVSADSNITVIIEEEELRSTNFEYNSESVENHEAWLPEMAQVRTGTLVMYHIDAKKDLLWKSYIIKNQVTDISDGLNSVSYLLKKDEDKIKLLFCSSGNGLLLNELNYFEIEKATGLFLTNKVVENPDKLVPLLPYFYWKDKNLILVGKKGLVGKNTFLAKYKF